ncbi:MAG TPA: hypothetical protein VMV74_03495 [Bacteroidales bacterium]|nr:hypothetical protein [Bacteroidales bacterium]
MYRYIFILLSMVSFTVAGAQEFIGLTDMKIKDLMSAENPGMQLDQNYKNEDFRYLKYVSEGGNETWLIFIGENGKCNGVRITCDSTIIAGKIRDLGRLYNAAGNNRWNYRSRGDEISVDLKNETYFFTITYRRADKRVRSGDNRAS